MLLFFVFTFWLASVFLPLWLRGVWFASPQYSQRLTPSSGIIWGQNPICWHLSPCYVYQRRGFQHQVYLGTEGIGWGRAGVATVEAASPFLRGKAGWWRSVFVEAAGRQSWGKSFRSFPQPSRHAPGTMQGSFLQARCDEPLMTTDWGIPLFIALVVLGLIYAFLYLPAITHRALLEEAMKNQSTQMGLLPNNDDWLNRSTLLNGAGSFFLLFFPSSSMGIVRHLLVHHPWCRWRTFSSGWLTIDLCDGWIVREWQRATVVVSDLTCCCVMLSWHEDGRIPSKLTWVTAAPPLRRRGSPFRFRTPHHARVRRIA